MCNLFFSILKAGASLHTDCGEIAHHQRRKGIQMCVAGGKRERGGVVTTQYENMNYISKHLSKVRAFAKYDAVQPAGRFNAGTFFLRKRYVSRVQSNIRPKPSFSHPNLSLTTYHVDSEFPLS